MVLRKKASLQQGGTLFLSLVCKGGLNRPGLSRVAAEGFDGLGICGPLFLHGLLQQHVLDFIKRVVVERSFSSSFMVIYRMFSWVWGMTTYSRALTRRRVFSISSAMSWAAFSVCASFSIDWNTSPKAATAPSSSPLVAAKP